MRALLGQRLGYTAQSGGLRLTSDPVCYFSSFQKHDPPPWYLSCSLGFQIDDWRFSWKQILTVGCQIVRSGILSRIYRINYQFSQELITDLKCRTFITHIIPALSLPTSWGQRDSFCRVDLISVYSLQLYRLQDYRQCLYYLNLLPDDVLTFVGNNTHSDHFKLLREDGNSLLIGARNVVYNLTLSDLTENTEMRISWNPRDRDRELCLVKGKSGDDCNNYIRVLARTDSDGLLVCGTNAYNPRCRNYSGNNGSVYEVTKEYSGKGYCPSDPRHNSTSIYTGESLSLSHLSGAS